MQTIDQALWRDFERDLEAAGRSENTISFYRVAVEQLAAFRPRKQLLAMTKDDVARYLIGVRNDHSSSTQASYFRGLRRFYNWAVAAEDIDLEASPLRGMPYPSTETKVTPVPLTADIRKVLRACAGKGHENRRDEAIIRLFCEPGSPRVNEMANLTTGNLDMKDDTALIHGKGNKWRAVPFGSKTGRAISSYLRARDRHPLKNAPRVWLGSASHNMALSKSGIYQMVGRRCDEAGVARMYPHQFRHYAAHIFFTAGGSVQDAMRLFGWADPKMAMIYAEATATRRAAAFARTAALGDDL
jgi:site-specific recombinase XerD